MNMPSHSPAPAAAARRNRNALLVILGLSFGTLLVAGALRFSGWQPQALKNKGELLQPYGDLRDHDLALVDGGRYRWKDSPRTWRIVAIPEGCDGARRAACVQLLESLDKVWRLMGREADRVHVLWGGALPMPTTGMREVHPIQMDARLRTALVSGTAVAPGDPVWLVDPNGFVVLRYPSGFDPGDLRSDLARLLKVN
ncbi:hypothetical protein EDC34_11317 [Thermomonas haemolytica]|uniref:Cytochrome oxidase Cu insertion factor (SCO1/SenC/PrrC family) n=2 Tax=Thermomonas haemolytica TaxID=141949 RepID=A0A4R3MUB1_9GAMM|nr:hypothetical protein EDC34_11317 [Thermomonas haemolytica]